jgi:hypothetical protein
MALTVSVAQLGRDLPAVASGLPQWQRGDVGEAAALTLAASSGDLHGRTYTLWVWTGFDYYGNPAWALPVTAAHAREFSPRGPAKVLARCLAAAVEAGAPERSIALHDWRGYTALVVRDAEPELAHPELVDLALRESHPRSARIAVAQLPYEEHLDGASLDLPARRTGGDGLLGLAHATGAHPVYVALTMATHGQPPGEDRYPPEMVISLREWGLDGQPPPVESTTSTGIDDDPCPRRRHARRVLRRLLRIGKVGSQYHTAFDHLHRGAPPDQRADTREVGEAMLRAGLLGEKPSVGQRHVYLRREALPRIHALIERGETDDPGLSALWTAPAPGADRLA